MAIQMLPLAQIGYALSSNQWTEEVPHAEEQPGKADLSDGLVKHFLPPVQHHFVSSFIDVKVLIYIHSSEKIPSNHSTDVVTPPPDVMA